MVHTAFKNINLVAAALALSCSVSALANDAAHPAVIELFQSQGCSSCPPAISNLNGIADRPEVLALTFAVTYWDQLGWKDTFAKPEFTDRERDYASRGTSAFATPQVVINGRKTVNGGNRSELVKAIRDANRGLGGPQISYVGGQAQISGAAASRSATVWLVRYDARDLKVPIRAGENGGRTLSHRNVVRSIASIATWQGKSIAIAIPVARDPNYRTAILVQSGKGGPIIAAARL
ncbi:MAG: DUF1223 domain-containing protein [Sphingomicrobium sp.]